MEIPVFTILCLFLRMTRAFEVKKIVLSAAPATHASKKGAVSDLRGKGNMSGNKNS